MNLISILQKLTLNTLRPTEQRAERRLSKRSAGSRSAIPAENYIPPGYKTLTSDDPTIVNLPRLFREIKNIICPRDFPGKPQKTEVA